MQGDARQERPGSCERGLAVDLRHAGTCGAMGPDPGHAGDGDVGHDGDGAVRYDLGHVGDTTLDASPLLRVLHKESWRPLVPDASPSSSTYRHLCGALGHGKGASPWPPRASSLPSCRVSPWPAEQTSVCLDLWCMCDRIMRSQPGGRVRAVPPPPPGDSLHQSVGGKCPPSPSEPNAPSGVALPLPPASFVSREGPQG